MTLIRDVRGNAAALCSTLTTALGVGGSVQRRGAALDVEAEERTNEGLSQSDLRPKGTLSRLKKKKLSYISHLKKVRRVI